MCESEPGVPIVITQTTHPLGLNKSLWCVYVDAGAHEPTRTQALYSHGNVKPSVIHANSIQVFTFG